MCFNTFSLCPSVDPSFTCVLFGCSKRIGLVQLSVVSFLMFLGFTCTMTVSLCKGAETTFLYLCAVPTMQLTTKIHSSKRTLPLTTNVSADLETKIMLGSPRPPGIHLLNLQNPPPTKNSRKLPLPENG